MRRSSPAPVADPAPRRPPPGLSQTNPRESIPTAQPCFASFASSFSEAWYASSPSHRPPPHAKGPAPGRGAGMTSPPPLRVACALTLGHILPRTVTEAAMPKERLSGPFITPGIKLSCVAVIAAGLLKVATGGELSGLSLGLVIALASAYALLLTVVLRFVEQRGRGAHLYALLGAAFVLGAAVVAMSRGSAFLVLMPLIFSGVLFFTPAGAAAVVIACTAVTLSSWELRGISGAELARELAIWIAPLVFTLVLSRIVLVQHRARVEMERLARN